MEPPLQVLRPDGSVAREDLVPRDDALLIRLYRHMRRARHFDERAVVLQRQGKLGVFPPYGGQEAAQVGSALALEAGDWLAPSYRETAAALAFGLPLARAILYWRTSPHGFAMDPGLNLLPFYVPIATQLPHVAGIALASKLRGDGKVAMGYIGDGGTSEGDFHTGVNFAGAYRAPAVFVIQNNGWAISVPTSTQTAAECLADRAVGYGIPGVRVDGNDVLAVHHVTREAVARARSAGGPTLIEAVTYRVRPHTTSDDTSRYRTEDEAVAWRDQRDPVGRMRSFLAERGLWDEERENALAAELEQELQAALAEADAAQEPEPWEILDQVFDEPTFLLREQMAELRREVADA
ncbi:MAG TPA: pyruvate dehydrogenase (acetyl-transferring) E1 component subunit alpha [Deinococcales bacterium]|nr:pyruvate dehydrogenase (acetyl-transferring) E1 component subunit alpha [Deinococcales bacterium]